MAEAQVNVTHSSPMRRKSRIFGQFIIKTRFQFKFGIMIFGFLSAASLLIWLEGHLAVNNMVASGMVTGEDAIAQLKLLNGIIGRTSVLAVAITFGLALFFSHFIAGPIYRFEKTLEQMRDGDLTATVKLRKFDELKEVADLFNQMLASLRNKVRKDHDSINGFLDKAAAVSEKLKQAGRDQEAAELDKLIQEVKSTPSHIHI